MLSFRILQLADLHYTGNAAWTCTTNSDLLIESGTSCTEATTTEFVNALLDAEQPDFVVFTGDYIQTFDISKRQDAVDAFTQGVEEREIHTQWFRESTTSFSREEILEKVIQNDHCFAQHGPSGLDGVGDYELTVQAPLDGAWGLLASYCRNTPTPRTSRTTDKRMKGSARQLSIRTSSPRWWR